MGGFSQYIKANNLTVDEYLGRIDRQVNTNNPLMIRGNGYTWRNPNNLGGGTTNPSQLYAATRTNHGFAGTWTSTHGPNLVNEVKGGFDYFDWTNVLYVTSLLYIFPTTQIGGPSNYPQEFTQSIQQYRDDLYGSTANTPSEPALNTSITITVVRITRALVDR